MLNRRKKIVPFVMRETTFGQHVCHLVSDVDILDLDLRIQIDSVERPIQRNSVCPRHMSQSWTSSFNNHLDNCLVILKDVQTGFNIRRVCVHKNQSYIGQINMLVIICLDLGMIFGLTPVPREMETFEFALPCVERNTSITMSHRSRAGKPSIRSPASVRGFCIATKQYSSFCGCARVLMLGGSDHMEDDDQDRRGVDNAQKSRDTRKRGRDQSEERQRTIRHMTTCG